jgi:hypothetical protein
MHSSVTHACYVNAHLILTLLSELEMCWCSGGTRRLLELTGAQFSVLWIICVSLNYS